MGDGRGAEGRDVGQRPRPQKFYFHVGQPEETCYSCHSRSIWSVVRQRSHVLLPHQDFDQHWHHRSGRANTLNGTVSTVNYITALCAAAISVMIGCWKMFVGSGIAILLTFSALATSVAVYNNISPAANLPSPIYSSTTPPTTSFSATFYTFTPLAFSPLGSVPKVAAS